MAADALLFDLDGTVWDSLPWYAAILSDGDADVAARLFERLRAGESVITLASGRGISKADLVRRCKNHATSLKLFPGVRETLQGLSRRKVPMGVVTSLSGDLANAMLDNTGLSEFFETVVHPGNCRPRKASGTPMRRALTEIGVDASESVFHVGDKHDDAAGAQACGLSFAWASFGYGEKPNGKHTILRAFAEVLSL